MKKDPTLWQTVQLDLVATPDLRSLLALGNSKMVTSVTWSSAGLFYNGSAADGDYSFLETYARLGFNVSTQAIILGSIKQPSAGKMF